MSDREGQQFGNYKLIRFLGDGSFADVYLGEHIYLKIPIAVKVLRMQLPEGDIDSFFVEARTIASLEHPHIVKVLDCGVDHNVPFLVMNYAPNGTLRQRHPNHTVLSPAVVLSYVNQVAPALQYAHDRKLIHRDIKPHNMLLGPKDELWLSDFGLALIAQSTISQITQNTAGTPGYMAPEQYSGKPRPASDQYSLAVVVYEWLCGERPFLGSYYELFNQHKFEPAPSLREKKPFISPAVEEVVLKALAKDTHQRFPSVQAFANALEEAYRSQPYLLPGSGVDLSAPSSQKELPPMARQPASVQETFNTLAPTVLFSPLRSSPSAQDVIAIALDKSSSPPEDKRAPALINTPAPIEMNKNPETPLPPVFLAPAPDEMNKNPETPLPPVYLPSPALSRRGLSRRAVLVGLAGAIGVVSGAVTLAWEISLHLREIGVATGTPIKSTIPAATPIPVGTPILTYHDQKNGVKAVAWSPNGQYIASGGVDHTVHVWNATTEKELIPHYGYHKGGLNSVAWSPDGRYIASGSEDGIIHVWNASTGNDLSYSPYTKHSNSIVRSVSWSPNGKYIASGSADGIVRVWDATNGQDLIPPNTDHTGPVITVAWSPYSTYVASAGKEDKTVKVLSSINGQTVLNIYPSPVSQYNGERAVAWSPDGNYIVSGGDDNIVFLWDVTSLTSTNNRPKMKFTGHKDHVQSVAWSPDGQHFASGSFDTTVKIWNVATGGLILTYKHHIQQVWSVAWSPDKQRQRIASASIDGTVQIWKPL